MTLTFFLDDIKTERIKLSFGNDGIYIYKEWFSDYYNVWQDHGSMHIKLSGIKHLIENLVKIQRLILLK